MENEMEFITSDHAMFKTFAQLARGSKIDFYEFSKWMQISKILNMISRHQKCGYIEVSVDTVGRITERQISDTRKETCEAIDALFRLMLRNKKTKKDMIELQKKLDNKLEELHKESKEEQKDEAYTDNFFWERKYEIMKELFSQLMIKDEEEKKVKDAPDFIIGKDD